MFKKGQDHNKYDVNIVVIFNSNRKFNETYNYKFLIGVRCTNQNYMYTRLYNNQRLYDILFE